MLNIVLKILLDFVVLVAVLVAVPSIFYKRIRSFISNMSVNENKSKNRTIIVVVDKKHENSWASKCSKKLLLSQGIYSLLKYFKKQDRNVRVYLWISKEKFKELIKDSQNKNIYIFGHGAKHGLKFENGDFLEYAELKDCPKKNFIGQYHCNAEGGTSLKEYLAKKGDVTNWYRFMFINALKIICLCKIIKKSPDELKEGGFLINCQ